jgi:hypothetical protein
MTTERACATSVSISDTQLMPTSDTPTADLIDLSDPLAIFEDASTASTVSRLLNVTQRTTNLSASNDRVESDPAPRIIVEDASASQQDEDAETVSIAESLFLPSATRQNANTTDSIIEWLQQFHPKVAEEFVDQVVGLTEIGLLRTDNIPRASNGPRPADLCQMWFQSIQTQP